MYKKERKKEFGLSERRGEREIYIIISNDALHTHKVNFNESQHFYGSHKRTPYTYIFTLLHAHTQSDTSSHNLHTSLHVEYTYSHSVIYQGDFRI